MVAGPMTGPAGLVAGGTGTDPMGGSGSGWMYGAWAGLVVGVAGSGSG